MQFTSTSSEARESLSKAIDGYVGWRVDVLPHLEAALERDPDFGMAHAFKGLFQYGGRSDADAAAVATARDRAHAVQDSLTDGERHYVRALDGLCRGRIRDGIQALESLLLREPTDLLAHRLLQQELFWGGEAAWMADVVDRASPAWRPDDPGYPAFLSLKAFSLEEAGRLEEAERAGREAVEQDPTDCWGAHAVAHVLVMRGDVDEGTRWLTGLSGNWEGRNQIVHHLWWHLCLFLLERGQHQRILELLDTQVRNPESPLVQAIPDAYIDLQNVASLYLRLELRGVDVGERWTQVGDPAANRIGNHASPFTSPHVAAILAACGRFEEAAELLDRMQAFAEGSSDMAHRFAVAALPAARAAVAHRRGEYDDVVATLLPARRDLWQMGGSHAQRDLFTQLLLDAAWRSGRTEVVRLLVQEADRQGFHGISERTLYRDALAAA